jgi:hypothetical protein
VPVLARKPGAPRNGAPFKDWVLSASMERVRRKLAGADDISCHSGCGVAVSLMVALIPALRKTQAAGVQRASHTCGDRHRRSCFPGASPTSSKKRRLFARR